MTQWKFVGGIIAWFVAMCAVCVGLIAAGFAAGHDLSVVAICVTWLAIAPASAWAVRRWLL